MKRDVCSQFAALLSMLIFPVCAHCDEGASLRALLEGRFTKSEPLRLVFERITLNDANNPSISPQTHALHCYEVNPHDLKTWRYDVLFLDSTGRGGGDMVSTISRKGSMMDWRTRLDDDGKRKFQSVPFEPRHAQNIVRVQSELANTVFTPNPYNRWFGITLGSLSLEQYFARFPQRALEIRKIANEGTESHVIVLKNDKNELLSEFDIRTGVMMSYKSGVNISVESHGQNKRIGKSFLFGVAERIVSETLMSDGKLTRSEVSVNQTLTRVLTQEEFEERLNPELPLGAYVSKDKAGQDTTIIEEDLPLRLWDYERLFTPERKAKGLIEYLKKAQE